MSVRTLLTRWLGGPTYPMDVMDRLDATVDELKAAIVELRETTQYLEENHGPD